LFVYVFLTFTPSKEKHLSIDRNHFQIFSRQKNCKFFQAPQWSPHYPETHYKNSKFYENDKTEILKLDLEQGLTIFELIFDKFLEMPLENLEQNHEK